VSCGIFFGKIRKSTKIASHFALEHSFFKERDENIQDLVSPMFNISEDITPFYEAMEKDAIIADLIRRLRGRKALTTPTVFEALIDLVIEQQISFKAAHSIENRLIRAVGNTLTLDGDTC
jgi:DNA-3-methyladenine glycosylase II